MSHSRRGADPVASLAGPRLLCLCAVALSSAAGMAAAEPVLPDCRLAEWCEPDAETGAIACEAVEDASVSLYLADGDDQAVVFQDGVPATFGSAGMPGYYSIPADRAPFGQAEVLVLSQDETRVQFITFEDDRRIWAITTGPCEVLRR